MFRLDYLAHMASEVKVSVTTRDAGSAGTGINTHDIDPMLMKCWVDILNDKPTMNQFSGMARLVFNVGQRSATLALPKVVKQSDTGPQGPILVTCVTYLESHISGYSYLSKVEN